MKPYYLLDTKVWSEAVKREPCPAVIDRIERYDGLLAMPSPVWHELLFGLERLEEGRRKRSLRAFLMEVLAPRVPVIPYDDHAAWVHASMRARLEAAGRPLPFVDTQIAAIAISNNLILVTRNLADYKGIQGLALEDWWQDN